MEPRQSSGSSLPAEQPVEELAGEEEQRYLLIGEHIIAGVQQT